MSSKIFSTTKKHGALELGIKYQELKAFQVCSKNHPRLIGTTYEKARLVTICMYMGKILKPYVSYSTHKLNLPKTWKCIYAKVNIWLSTFISRWHDFRFSTDSLLKLLDQVFHRISPEPFICRGLRVHSKVLVSSNNDPKLTSDGLCKWQNYFLMLVCGGK